MNSDFILGTCKETLQKGPSLSKRETVSPLALSQDEIDARNNFFMLHGVDASTGSSKNSTTPINNNLYDNFFFS